MHSNNQSNAPDSKEKILQGVGKYLQSKNNVSQDVIETLSLDLENHYGSLVQSIQTYIGNKTGKKSTEITFKDIEGIDRNTINEELIPFKVLTPSSILTFNPQAKVYITDNETGEVHAGYPRKKRLNEDDEFSDEPNQEGIMLSNPSGESKYFPFTVITNEYCIDTTRYAIQQTHSEKSHNPLSEAVLLHMIKDKCVTLDEFEINDQTNILDNAATPLPHHKSDTESILQAGSHPRHTKNKKNASPFTGYEFSHYSQIPDAVKKEMEERKIKTPKARIYQGIISFNKDYFCEKYGISDIERKKTDAGKQLIFSFPDNVKRTVWEMYADEKTKGCIKEMIATKTHEITHRLLHYHGLHTLKVPTIEGKKVIVDQEFLCEVADRESRLREKTENGTYFVRYHDGKQEHTIYCDALEDHIEKKIKGFTRQNIKGLDIKQLDHYLDQCGRLDSLAATNAATTNSSTTTSTSPSTTSLTEEQIKQYTPIRKKHIDDYINNQGLRLNLNNAHEKKKFDDILTLKDKITDIEAKLASGTPLTPDELADAQETHQAVSDFFHPHQSTTPNQTSIPPTTRNNQSDDDDDDDGTDDRIGSPSSDTTSEQNSPETIDHQQFENDFVSVLAKDGSESGVKFEKNTVIFVKDTISTTPGYGHNRVKYVITGIGENTISLRMEDATENNVTGSKVFTMPKTQETIDKIAKIGKQSTLLFKKTEKNNFTKKIGDFVGGQRSKIGSDFTKSYTDQGKTKKGPITHVGSIKGKITGLDKTENVIYKVERGYNKVTVSGQVNKKDISKDDKQKKELRTKQMDFDTFMVFCKSKGLLPYNEQEVKRAGISVDPSKIPESEISRKDKFVSLGAVRNFLKEIPESIKKKREEEQEFQTALAKTYFADRIPNTGIAYLDEIRGEIGGMDAVVWQKIQKYKSGRTGGGEKSDVHDVPIFEGMRDALFLNPSNRRNFKYQAASGLLYALEKGSLYPRALAPYANKDGGGYWIKIILGDEMHQEFKIQRQNLIDQWRSQGLNNDDNFYDKLVKYELEFIEKATTDKPFWGSKFGREVEGHKDKLFGGADSIDSGGIAAKGNFDAMYEAFLGGGIKGNNPKTLFSALKAMEGAIETDNDLSLFYQCILLIFVTGIVHILPNDYRSKLAGIGRAKGIPVALFASNTYASGKVVRLLDHIAKNSGMRSFSDYCGSSPEDFDNKDVSNYAQIIGEDKDGNPITAQQELTNNFKDWWSSAGDIIINGFAPGENLLKTKKYPDPDGGDVPSKTKDVVSSYLGEGGIFNDYLGNQGDDYLRGVDAQTPIFQKNLMNLAKGPLKSILGLSGKNLQINADETTQQMRKNFVQIIGGYETTLKSIDPETIEPMMSFLYGKYLQMFGDKLTGHYNKSTYKNNLEEAMRTGGTTGMNTLRTIVKNGIIGEKTKSQQRQQQLMNPNYEDIILRADIGLPIAQDGIHAFSELLFKGMEGLSDEIKERIIKTGNKFSGSE